MITEEVEFIIDKLCRCCMCENENMQNLFGDTNHSSETTIISLSEMLIACASVEVKSEDALPNTLCKSCEEKLKSFYEFRILCQKSDSTLRDLLKFEDNNISSKTQGSDITEQDLDDDLFDEDDEKPLIQRSTNNSTDPPVKRKRGRPKKSEANLHTCTYCNKILHTAKGLKTHLRGHTGEKMKQCLFCDAKYTRTNHLMRHIITHDKPGVKHPCEHCDKTFVAAADLFKHSSMHFEDSDEKVVVKEEELVQDIPDLLDPKDIEETINQLKVQIGENQVTEGVHEKLSDNNDEIVDSVIEDFIAEDEGLGDQDVDSDENDIDCDKGASETKKLKTEGEEDPKIIYECSECHKVLSTPRGLKIHMRRHIGTNTLYCKFCNKTFSKRNQLVRHMNVHIEGNEEIIKELDDKGMLLGAGNQIMECDYCDRKFKYRKSFANHMQIEHGISDAESDTEKEKDIQNVDMIATNVDMIDNAEAGVKAEEITILTTAEPVVPPNELTEDQCVETTTNNADVVSDPSYVTGDDTLNSSNKSRSKNQVCHVCNANFARVNHLTRHMILHRNVLVHQCGNCDRAFATPEHLKKHFEDEHINKPYVCTVCNKPFSRGEHLIRHLKVHQSNTNQDENLKCSICDLTFARSDILARHTKVHLLQDKRHVCVDCGKAFNRLDNLKTHQRIHTGIKDTSKLHLCIYCGKEFNNSSNMIVHMRRHTGERPYKCGECGKGFPRSHDLKCHERTHSGEKPYLCTLCGKSFNKSNKLLRHSRVHTGERPYVCNICGRAFTQSNDLSLHMRRHTGARPYACGVCPARFIQSGQLKAHKRTTGHWIETQPDLKGGHRVEPVTPAHEPIPIRFKSHRMKKEEQEAIDNIKPNITNIPVPPIENHQEVSQEEAHTTVTLTEVQSITVPPQRILMGFMGNIKLQNESLLIDSSKLVELHNAGLMNLPSVIQTANGEEIKLKSEVANFAITQCGEADIEKQDDEAVRVFEDGAVIYSSVGHTSTTYTVSDNFNFQNYH